jgi:biopolymer transport protein ExbD
MQYERRWRRKSSIGLNLTPLIDIVFLLLVFFLLTAHFVKEKRLDIELPTAESGDHIEEDKVVEVEINQQGTILVNGRATADESLVETLKGALHAPVEKRVRLRADKTTQLDRVVKVMDASRIAGAQSLDILTESE